MDSAGSAVGSCVFIRAQAGMGKSSLLAAAAAASQELTILAARGSPMGAGVPLALIEDVLGPVPGQSLTDPLANRTALRIWAATELAARAALGPVVVLLDDLHWADPASIDVVEWLMRRSLRLGVAFVSTLRPWPAAAGKLAEQLAHEHLARVVELDPLSPTGARRLLEACAGALVADALADRAWRLAGGNPLLIKEAGRCIGEEGDLPAGGGNLSRLQRMLLLSHVAGLPLEAIECAQAAAALGGRMHIATVEAMCDIAGNRFVAGFDALVAAGILRQPTAASAEFTHDLLAAAILDDTPPARRRLLHARAFEALAARGDTLAAAAHALAGDLAEDSRAVSALSAAATLALQRGAPEAALANVEGAVRLAGAMPPVALLTRRADVLFATGHPAEAARAYRSVLPDIGGEEQRSDLRIRLARAEAFAGNLGAAQQIYDNLAGKLPPGPQLISVLLERSHLAWELHGPVAALRALEPPDGVIIDPLPQIFAAIRSYFLLESGDASEAGVLDALAIAARHDPAGAADQVVATLDLFSLAATALGMRQRFDEAFALAEFGKAALRKAGALHQSATFDITRQGMLLYRGRLAEVVAESTALEDSLELTALQAEPIRLFRAQALVWQGQLDAAEGDYAAVVASPGARAWYIRVWLAVLAGELRHARGDPSGALEHLREAEQLAATYGVGEPCLARLAASLVEAALDAGQLADVERVASSLEQATTRLPCLWPPLIAAGARAGLAAVAGRPDQADAAYQHALSLPSATPLDRARVVLRYGEWLRRKGRVLQARPLLSEALATFSECGAAPLAERAAAELRAAGGRRRRQASNQLTPQEARVATLAIEGAGAREIATALHLSVRTVEAHLSNVYRKSGASSKVELRRGGLGLAPRPAAPT